MSNKQKPVQVRDVQDVIEIIGGRGPGVILTGLYGKVKRCNELKRDLGNITPRALIRELKIS